VEEVEYTRPREAVEKAGGQAELVSLRSGSIQSFNHLDKSTAYEVEVTAADADPGRYDALVLPGGVANPDALRTDPDALRFVRAFFDAGKPVGAICHAPWTMIDAGVVDGRTLTSWPSLRTDLTNAGATWVDEECHVDKGLVTSRKPDDLPAFCDKLVEEIAQARH
jgi:protease I